MSPQPENLATQALMQAQETIARQSKEIEALQQQVAHEHFAQKLRKLLISVKNTSIILSPFTHSHVLEMVVTTAAQVISAQSGSLYLIDEKAQDLVFEVAIGPAGQEVKKFRVPLGHGIAGMVALTGQPMAIADAEQDEHFAIDIATAVNYIPKSILCVPLFYDDRVIGALELLDKIDAKAFDLTDMQTLGLFANIAAVAIAQSQTYHDQQSIFSSLLHFLGERGMERDQSFLHDATAFSNWVQEDDPISKTARELAFLVHELIQRGEAESEMCKSVLQSFVGTLRSRGGVSVALSGM